MNERIFIRPASLADRLEHDSSPNLDRFNPNFFATHYEVDYQNFNSQQHHPSRNP